jgi:hypothetical protein
LIFALVLILGLAAARWMLIAPEDLAGYFQVLLFYASLVLAYLVTYSAIYAHSPTFLIVLKVAEAGSRGLSRQELEEALGDEMLVKPRIKDLVDDSLAYLQQGRYRLTFKGRIFTAVFIFFRRLLNAGLGG